MRRDMDLIRLIMFKIEEHPAGFAPQGFSIEGYTEDEVAYHVWLLGDAGLMKVADATNMHSSGPEATPVHLTSAGHDFLDAARNDTIWAQAKQALTTIGGPVSLTVLKTLLDSLMKAKLGL